METSYYFRPVNSQPYPLSTYSPQPYLSGETLVNNYLANHPKRNLKIRERKETVSVVLPKVEYLTDSQKSEVVNHKNDKPISGSTYLQSKTPPKELKKCISIQKIEINTTQIPKSASLRFLSCLKETPCSRQSVRTNCAKYEYTKSREKQVPARKRNIQRSNSCYKITYNNYLCRASSENGLKPNLLDTRFSIVSALDAGNRLIYTKTDNNLHKSIKIPLRNMILGKFNVSKLQNAIKIVPIEGEGILKKVASAEFVPIMLANSQNLNHSMLKKHRNSKHNNL